MDKIESNLQTAIDYYREGELKAALDCIEEAWDDLEKAIDRLNEKE